MAFPTNGRWDAEFQLKNKNGNNISLAGKQFAMGFVSELRKETPDLILSTMEGTLETRGSGILKMNVPYSIVKTLNQGEYYFDIIEILDGGDQGFVAEGKIYLRRGITRL